ncbi:hypothetical protein ACH5A2_15375 [Streptomyces collinus]|uniref:hypothetical protein n=1 Tax=Streptomyces collinus TaxID=42684 RepID=UPI003788B243
MAAAATALVTALPLAVGALCEGSLLATAPALVAGLTALVFLPDLCQERRPARHARTRSTARTPTGRRSVDLTRVASVRLWTTFSPGGVQQRVLLVRDVHGVRLGITSAAGRRALRTALAGQQGRRARVSPAARACLGDGPGWWLVRHTVTMFLSQVAAVCVYLIGFLEVSGLA